MQTEEIMPQETQASSTSTFDLLILKDSMCQSDRIVSRHMCIGTEEPAKVLLSDRGCQIDELVELSPLTEPSQSSFTKIADTQSTTSQTENLEFQYIERLKEKCAELRQELALKSELEVKMEELLSNSSCVDKENRSLKEELRKVQSQVMETRRMLDKRRHYDSEVERWISGVKNDLGQMEFKASMSHQGLHFYEK